MAYRGRRKTRTTATKGRIFITATFNNTLITVTDEEGNTICWGSAGRSGFRGARKSTPFAATAAVQKTIRHAVDMGLKEAKIYIKGPGAGRDAALRALRNVGIKMTMIADVTPLPHNGVRPPKKRRV